MNLDFLGIDPVNYVELEPLTLLSNGVILLDRGFFFSDSLTLFDYQGKPIDPSGYSFDIPIPSMAARTGRLVFGRIIMNTGVLPATATYRTPYYESDNRSRDLEYYNIHGAGVPSYDYYNHFSGLFKSTINELSGADIDAWMSAMERVVQAFRNRVIGDDVLLDIIDEVFTRGIIRYPEDQNVSSMMSPMFIPTGPDGNSIKVSKWSAEWTIGNDTFNVDYSVLRGNYQLQMEKLEGKLQTKFIGSVSELMDEFVSIKSTPVERAIPVTSIGTTLSDDIAIISDKWYLQGIELPEYYSGIQDLVLKVEDYCDKIIALVDDIENEDIGGILTSMESYQNALNDGYTSDDVTIIDSTNLIVKGLHLSGVYVKESMMAQLEDIYLTGDYPSQDNLTLLKDVVDRSEITIDLPELTAKADSVHMLSEKIMTTLDGLCITKESTPHTVGSPLDLGDIL